MTFKNLLKRLKKANYKIEYKKYKKWENVPHASGTALVIHYINKDGSEGIFFESTLTYNYIIEQIEEHRKNLGVKDYKNYNIYDRLNGESLLKSGGIID